MNNQESGNDPQTINLTLERYEAKELADFLDGSDAHLSVGDRLFLSRRIHTLLKEGEVQ